MTVISLDVDLLSETVSRMRAAGEDLSSLPKADANSGRAPSSSISAGFDRALHAVAMSADVAVSTSSHAALGLAGNLEGVATDLARTEDAMSQISETIAGEIK